jgi:hypothetical protein
MSVMELLLVALASGVAFGIIGFYVGLIYAIGYRGPFGH